MNKYSYNWINYNSTRVELSMGLFWFLR